MTFIPRGRGLRKLGFKRLNASEISCSGLKMNKCYVVMLAQDCIRTFTSFHTLPCYGGADLGNELYPAYCNHVML